MEGTQSFRLIGSQDITEIPCSHVSGQNIVYWEDINQVFPGVQHVEVNYGDVTVTMVRNLNHTRIEPHYIKHYPGVILDVILSSAASPASRRPLNDDLIDAATSNAPDNTLINASNKHSSTEPCQVFESAVIPKLDGLSDQGAKTQQLVQGAWKWQKLMKSRSFLIQSKTEAILNQQLKLADHPFPRLFVVLPEEPAKFNPDSWFRSKFRLHFICECGKHTEASDKLPHQVGVHLVKHEGYLVREPIAFFKKYGPFLFLMLELLKTGTRTANHVMPTMDSLEVVELLDNVKQTVEFATAKIEFSLKCIDSLLGNAQAVSDTDITDTAPLSPITQRDLTTYLSDVKGLESEGLHQLGSLLRLSEEEDPLGNLYRITTSNGHVKWVCHDHYSASLQMKHVRKLREVIDLSQGEFDEQLGKITITLTSSFAATGFYTALKIADNIVDLDLRLAWSCTNSDLEELDEALKRTRVAMLRLDLRHFRANLAGKSPAVQHIFSRFMDHGKMTMIHIVLPRNLIQLSSFPRKKPSHIRKLFFETVPGSIGRKDLGVLSEMLEVNASLTDLSLFHNTIGYTEAHILSKALKKNSTLTTLNLQSNSIGDEAAQVLSEALKTNSTLTTLNLQSNTIKDSGALALSEALKTNTTLTTLDLKGNKIGFPGTIALVLVRNLNSTLITLDLHSNSIGVEVAKTLHEALKTNSTLTALDLQNKKIGGNAVQALANALKTNSNLIALNLPNNEIGDNGAQALADALKTNSTLIILNLHNNDIEDDGAQALAGALKINSTLTTLNLQNNKMGVHGVQALDEVTKTTRCHVVH